jgi:hypothetical protein
MAYAWICTHEEKNGKRGRGAKRTPCKGRSRRTFHTKEEAIASAMLHKHPLNEIKIVEVHGNLKCRKLRDLVAQNSAAVTTAA